MLWRILVLLVKPTVLLALFELLSRVLVLTGLQPRFVAPIAASFAHLTGLPYNYSVILMVGLIACSLMRVLTALCSLFVASVRQ
jgi:hypothetical protein